MNPRAAASAASTEPISPPEAPSPARNSAWTAAAALGAWFAVNLAMLAPDFGGAVLRGGRHATPALALLLAVPSSLVLAAAGWAAFRLTRLHPVARRGLARSLALHASAALGFAALDVGVRKAERLLLADPGPGFAAARDAGELAAVVMLYAALAVAAHAVEYARRYRERRLAALRLQASLARAELERASAELRVLKLQLTPHFLFNSLHAASALVLHAPDDAGRMVARLADLLRHAAGRAGTWEVPLDEEVRTLAAFLEVEEIRLGGRLRVEWEIEGDARRAWVPHMVLQPLAENAVKHGLAGRPDGGCVRVSARRAGGWLELAVSDDGVGLEAAADHRAPGAGIGTANTRARLAQLYGDAQALEIAPAAGGGTRVSLRLPWHEAPMPAPALEAAPAETLDARDDRRFRVKRIAAAVLFLVLWRSAYAGMLGLAVRPHRIVGAAEAAVCGMLNAALLALLLFSAAVSARRAPAAGRRGVWRHVRAALGLSAAVALERNLCLVAWGSPAAVLASPAVLRAMATEAAAWAGAYAAVSLVSHALEYARRSRAGEAAGLRLQASLARAELQRTSAELRGLQMRVNPAFLFTALDAVASRVHHAPADAERMVVRLADLLRRAMAARGEREVPLEEEMRALEPFLEVERIRLRGRLRVEWEMEDDALDALIPPTLLQPLVADAVAAAGEGEARVTLSARRCGEMLEIGVRGGDPSTDPSGGDAAGEIRDRLSQFYGGDEVEVVRGDGIVIRLPWHEEPWPATTAARTEAVPR
ncbi:sensor histidine kinase [Longimicrobium sp.]|uniref:sensor histidine kinase n=1 Tax=Longimicrobium sp. TaxID=2029185 RepID=UPI002D00DCE2|nr:histidine kinase [Longimicrobium sp.]HSU17163.1 histidine kinase [Longimicrobium sp.]